MVYEPANAVAFRQRLLTNPGERQDVDYKSSMAFTTDDSFSLNLIRHIQGMANAGGGWLVIGLKKNLSDKEISKLNRFNINNRGKLKVITFDEILEQGRTYFNNIYFR